MNYDQSVILKVKTPSFFSAEEMYQCGMRGWRLPTVKSVIG